MLMICQYDISFTLVCMCNLRYFLPFMYKLIILSYVLLVTVVIVLNSVVSYKANILPYAVSLTEQFRSCLLTLQAFRSCLLFIT